MNSSDLNWAPPQYINYIVVIICAVVILTGVLGNVIVLLIIGFVPSMKTPVNLCLASLAVIDTIILSLLPILPAVSTLNAAIGKEMCYFLLTIDRGTVACSVLAFLLISLERYIAICHPLLSARLLTKKVTLTALAGIWVLATIVSVPYVFIIHYMQETSDENNTMVTSCYYDYQLPWMYIYDTLVVATMAFGPVPMLFALYLRMRSALQTNIPAVGVTGSEFESGDRVVNFGRRGRLQVTKMLFVVIVIFVICQLPYAVLVMLEFYHREVFPFSGQSTPVIYASLWMSQILFYVNSAINPIIYFSMSSRFREGFGYLFLHHRKQSLKTRGLSPATSSDRF